MSQFDIAMWQRHCDDLMAAVREGNIDSAMIVMVKVIDRAGESAQAVVKAEGDALAMSLGTAVAYDKYGDDICAPDATLLTHHSVN